MDVLPQEPCTRESDYGFREGKPCILIKLNKIFAWEPVPYKTEEDLPENLPISIKTAFKKNIEEGNQDLVRNTFYIFGFAKSL